MTVSSTTYRVNYTGSGTVGPFSFPFRIQYAADLLVVQRSDTGVETTLSYPGDFAYSTGAVGSRSGGSITLTTALTTGYTLALVRNPERTQLTNLRNQGRYFPSDIEDALDRGVMIAQAQDDIDDRVMSLPMSVDPTVVSPVLPAPVADQFLMWNPSATALTSGTVSTGSIVIPAAGRTVSTATALLANNIGTEWNVLDFGVLLDDSTDCHTQYQNCLNACGSAGGGIVRHPLGFARTSVQLNVPSNVWIVMDHEEQCGIRATATATFANCPYVLYALSKTNVGLFNATIDANGAARVASAAITVAQTASCVNFDTCTNPRGNNITVKGSMGSSAPVASAASFGLGGTGTGGRFGIINAVSCGIAGRAADGFYSSNSDTAIELVTGTDVTDTAAVLESGVGQYIETVISTRCYQPAAISSTGTTQAQRQYIGTVIADGWNSAVAGGIDIVLLGSTATLKHCGIGKIVMQGVGGFAATGPAIGITNSSSGGGVIDDLSLDDITIYGGTAQGVLTSGVVTGLRSKMVRLNGQAGTPFQTQAGCTDVQIQTLDITPSATSQVGLITADASDFHVGRFRCKAGAALNYCAYHFGTGTDVTYAELKLPASVAIAFIGSDAGALPNLLALRDGTLVQTKSLNTVIDASGNYQFVDGANGKITNLSRIIGDSGGVAINNHANTVNNVIIDDATGNLTARGTVKGTGFTVGSDVVVGARLAGFATQTGASSGVDLGATPTLAAVAQCVTAVVNALRNNHKLLGP